MTSATVAVTAVCTIPALECGTAAIPAPAVVDHLVAILSQTAVDPIVVTIAVAALMTAIVEIVETWNLLRFSAVAVSFAAKLWKVKLFLLVLMKQIF